MPFYNLSKNVQSCTIVVDSSFVKNVAPSGAACGRDVVGRNPTDRGRKATKVSLITNEHGTPLTTCFHKANKNDCASLRHIMDTCARKTNALRSATTLLADKGYDSETCRSVCKANGLADLIPKRGTKDTYTGRYVIEQTFGILDQYRRIRVRYESTLAAPELKSSIF
jgi:putative transposase